MGISSTGFLSNVIAGKKNLNDEMSKQLGKIIKLAAREQHYLHTMVTYTQAKTIEEKKKFLDQLLSIKKSELTYMQDNQMSIFSKWYYVYIRDLLCFYAFKDDYKSLAESLDPPIKPEEAESAIHDLEKLGFISKNSDGYYQACDHLVSTGDEVHSVQLANFQLTTMDMAKRSLAKHSPQNRDISFVSLTLSAESFANAKFEIQAFRKKLLLLANDEQSADCVYQCNIQLFPVTRQSGGTNE
jgi:uncharacterized protein (TIGR02147 family)